MRSSQATCGATRQSSRWIPQRFEEDRLSAPVLARVQRDVESGLASGQVHGTPTLFIDGVLHVGPYDTDALMQILRR